MSSPTNTAWNTILQGLTPKGNMPPRDSPQHITADACATSLASQRLFPPKLFNVHGVLGETLWDAIVKDSESAWEARRYHYGRYISNVTASIVECISESGLLSSLTQAAKCKNLSSDLEATYLYYENGSGLPLHLDNDSTYEYNLLTCISKSETDLEFKPSQTYFYLGNGQVKSASLFPGSAIWFHAGYTPHARTPLQLESKVTLLSVGMRTESND